MGSQAWREAGGAQAPAEALRVETGDGAISVQRFGARGGPAVVIVPGTAAWSGFWVSAARALGDAGFDVVAVDLPPFGFSDRPADGDYSRQAQAQRLAGAIARLRLNKPVVLAHSFGAGAATELAMRHTEALGGLALVDGALALPSDGAPPAKDPAWLQAALAQPWLARAAVDAVMINPLATRRLLAGLLARPESGDAGPSSRRCRAPTPVPERAPPMRAGCRPCCSPTGRRSAPRRTITSGSRCRWR